jgi:hypothetical protein
MLMGLVLMQCGKKTIETPASTSSINTSHLDALYDEIKMGGDTVGIIHLYAEAPDYQWKGDDNEGMACVDDASRSAIFYLRQYKAIANPEYLRKGRMLVKFLLAMQSPNGYYYNFIWPDGTIHKDGVTTKAEPNWWSWRALWAFGEALAVIDVNDKLEPTIRHQREVLANNILKEESYASTETDTAMGITIPTWLPKTCGTDQASIILIGLSMMLEQYTTRDVISKDTISNFIRHFAEGMYMMQIEQPDSLHDGAFLSWENLWHAYGNIQAYALMTAGQVIDDPHMTSHGLYEVDHFYPAYLKAGGMDHFWVKVVDGKLAMYDAKQFPQIAYGRRPMIWAALKAYEMTEDKKYLKLAKDLGEWFTGQNPAKFPMYDAATGRGYDGINAPDQINKNAGAESTIESLLSMQELEKCANN